MKFRFSHRWTQVTDDNVPEGVKALYEMGTRPSLCKSGPFRALISFKDVLSEGPTY